MNTINNKHHIEITVLSPLAIGAGAEKDWVKGIDFIEKDGELYLLNLKKLVDNGIDPAHLINYFTNKDSAGLLRKIEGKLKFVSDRVMMLPAKSENEIKSFIKNELSGNPIIPGSSLKGAVRSVILEYLLNGNKPRHLSEKEYFGNSKDGDDLMRFIKFSDSEFGETALVNTKIFNLHRVDDNWEGGWKHSGNHTNANFQPGGFNTLYECILPNQKSVCSVMLSDSDLFNEKIERYREYKHKLLDIKKLFTIINKHTTEYIDKEIDFFKVYPTNKTDRIVESLNSIKSQVPADNSICILKMSAGSGFHSITGDWQLEDYKNTGQWETGDRNRTHHAGAPKYKSRKIACQTNDTFSLMGFVKLRVMTDEEVSQYEQDLTHRKAEQEEERRKIAEERQMIQKEKARAEVERLETEKAEKERLAKENAEREAAQKAEEIRLANLSPDDREKEKYQNGITGELINDSLQNSELTKDFFQWLKEKLISEKSWKTDGDPKKNKSIKRCQNIEQKIIQ